jgi:hypothetical protein
VSVFKEITQNDIKTSRSYLNQLVDILQQNISGSSTRRKYTTWVTGGRGPGVSSSLWQTVYDADFTLQTANPIFDMTVGLYYSGSTVQNAKTGEDSSGKILFASSSVQMREKVDIYKQFAANLLGDATAQFYAPFDSTTNSNAIDSAMFVCFKRLFSRDGIKRETFAMKFYQTGARDRVDRLSAGLSYPDKPNLVTTSESGSVIYTDIGSAATKLNSFGGAVGNIVDAGDTTRTVGTLFYDRGIAIFDLAKIISGSQHVSGVISAVNNNTAGTDLSAGQAYIGSSTQPGGVPSVAENKDAKFIPDFLVSGSMDNILDYFASTRFSSGSQTAITFQNITNINSTLFFLNLGVDEFNYSANSTYTDSNNRIVVIDEGQEESQQSFTFVTRVGLYDANDNLLAVGALSRPVEKSSEKAFTVKLRLDYSFACKNKHLSYKYSY